MDNSYLTQGDLILLCIRKIQEAKEDCTFERLVYECFTSFPNRFSFCTYKLPDSLKLDRQLRSLRKQGFIVGNNRSSFQLTSKGSKRASQISSQSSNMEPEKTITRKSFRLKGGRKEGLLIDKVISSSLFRKHQEKIYTKPNIDELRLLFFGTLETSVNDLLENMDYCKKIAQKAGKIEVVKFIVFYKEYLEERTKKQTNGIK